MFRTTRDPKPGSSIQCLAKITVMVLSSPSIYFKQIKYFIIILIVSTNYIFVQLLHNKVF